MTAKQYQETVYLLLCRKFSELDVRNEWAAFEGNRQQYSPRVDLAIGPFSTIPGYTLEEEYNKIVIDSEVNKFIKKLYDFHFENISSMNIPDERMEINFSQIENVIFKNQNARCLFAIEIENTNSKKHMMGSLINAASLGRLGVGIAFTESAMRTFIRIMNYLAFLKRVEKNTYDTTNFLIVTKAQFHSLL